MTETSLERVSQRIGALRAEMAAMGLDAIIVPRFDAHQGEYVAPHDQRLAHVTGFSGSAGVAIVTAAQVAVFVDGRYTAQVAIECAGDLIERRHLYEEPPEEWLGQAATAGWVVGFDPMHLPPTWYHRFAEQATRVGATMLPTPTNLVDSIWQDQPPAPLGQISAFPVQLSGMNSTDKRAELMAHMDTVSADYYVDTQPDNIAWFLNVRGADVDYNPMPQSFMLAHRAGQVTWFVDQRKYDEDLESFLPSWLEVLPQEQFLPTLAARFGSGNQVLIDPDFSAVAVELAAQAADAKTIMERNFLSLTKARKNPTELEGMRACHIQDGVAWTEFSAWLAGEVPARARAGHPLSEREAEDQMLAFRRARPGYLSESFKPISAASGNAAMCHYASNETRNALILPENPYLLDSGGQFESGTTDATRSFSFGQTPDGYRRAYTAVFKAFHALATLRFPQGTQGHHIDAICRRPMWDLGLDYDHGTGHGVGHQLSVHEQPQRIGKPYNPVDLKPGMVLSIEPGYYVTGKFGIRIENLFEIVQAADGFLEFKNLTWAPIQTDMLDVQALSAAEIGWLNDYHHQLVDILGPFLSPSARVWVSQGLVIAA